MMRSSSTTMSDAEQFLTEFFEELNGSDQQEIKQKGRSEKSKIMHNELIRYMDRVNYHPAEINKRNVVEYVIRELDRDSILEVSANGFSLLIDAINLTALRMNDNKNSEYICIVLMALILRRAEEIDSQEQFSLDKISVVRHLLLAKSKYGSTPLKYILFRRRYESLIAYLEEVECAIDSGKIESSEYVNLMTAKDKDGFNPLFGAIKSDDERIVQVYLGKVISFYNNQLLSGRDFGQLLISKPSPNVTPFRTAIKSNNHKIVAMYLDALELAYQENCITHSEFINAIVQTDGDEISLFHLVMTKGNEDMIDLYYGLLSRLQTNGLLSHRDYFTLLTHASHADYSPLHQIILSCGFEDLRIYLYEVKSSLEGECTITGRMARLKQLLMQPTVYGSTPLHLIGGKTARDKLDKLELLISELQQCASVEDCFAALNAKNGKGKKPGCADNLESASEINVRLEQLRSSTFSRLMHEKQSESHPMRTQELKTRPSFFKMETVVSQKRVWEPASVRKRPCR